MTTGRPGRPEEDLQELKELLLGPERRRIEEAERRLSKGLAPDQIAEHLPEAVALRARRDKKLARALGPTIEAAIGESVRRNPREIATAIFPVLGPAIRKAIAETMANLVRSINSALEHSFSVNGIRWRLEAWRTGRPFAEIVIKHSLVYRVEQVFLIHAESGILLTHAALPDLPVANADLVAAMLTAIQDFVSDSFSVEDEGARLRTFAVGELTVMVERGPRAILAAVVRGEAPPILADRLQETLETVHLHFGDLLGAFNGEIKPFTATLPYLESCLTTVLAQEVDTAPGRGRWVRWALPLAVIVVGIGWLVWRSNRAWRSALDRLSAEPGIVVVNADHGWRRWSLGGLRDPVASDPKMLLAGMGVDTTKVDGIWRPYLSLDRSVVLERARRALDPPESVRFDLAGDSLVASGRASTEWIARARAGGPPPGITRLDLSLVGPVLSPELGRLTSEIENRLILFPIGSASPLPGSWRSLLAVRESFRQLDQALAPSGYRAALEVVGRTDSIGSDPFNEALSQVRADSVRNRLIRIGLPAAALTPIGVDGSRPLSGETEAARAVKNRSVAFVVRQVADSLKK